MIESNWVRQGAGSKFLLVDKRVFRKIVEREKVRTIRLPGTYPLYFLPDLADIAKRHAVGAIPAEELVAV